MEARLMPGQARDILPYLGRGRGESEAEMLTQITQVQHQLLQAATPRLTYRVFENRDDPQLRFLFESENMRALLQDSRKIVLFAATLGTGVDALMARLQIADLGKAVVADACANYAIETVCDSFGQDLEREFPYLTDRFSPGYGDFPFQAQKNMAEILNLPKTVGITLTASGLMVPQKSVTAVLGIADSPQTRRISGCAHCHMRETCTLRKEEKDCGTH